jgi:hypothetical protein
LGTVPAMEHTMIAATPAGRAISTIIIFLLP